MSVKPAATEPSREELQVRMWLDRARDGSSDAKGRLLEACRLYLLAVANEEMPSDLRPKVGASDVVQETFLEAHRDLSRFVGASEQELLGWLRAVLRHNLANHRRRYQGTEMRDLAREVSLDQPAGDRGPLKLPPAHGATPSADAAQREQTELLLEAIARLPWPLRTVIVMRHRENSSFEEIGGVMGRSPAAIRKLWARGIARLRAELAVSESV